MRPFISGVLQFFESAVAFDDTQSGGLRRGIILNILLLSAVFLSFAAAVTIVIDPAPSTKEISGSLQIVFDVFLVFAFLYLLSRLGKVSFVSRAYSAGYFILATIMAFLWGPNVPQALLFYALSIAVSSILVGSGYALFLAVAAVVTLPSIFFVHRLGLFIPDVSWRSTPLVLADLLIYGATFMVIFVVSWLYNREIKSALQRVKTSEAELKKERDLLEVRIAERTADFKKENLERIAQLSRFVEFGKLSSGIFHDLANHLSALLLMMDEKATEKSAEISRVKGYLEEFRGARADLEKFLASNKRRLREVSYAYFSPDEEIKDLIRFILNLSDESPVKVEFLPGANGEKISGSPSKFGHIVTNLISNAIESYESYGCPDGRKVIIKTSADEKFFMMEIRDFGCGISEDNKRKIFDPFFTTKGEDKGTGLGLVVVKETLENDFGGEISFDSRVSLGSVFNIKIPLFRINV